MLHAPGMAREYRLTTKPKKGASGIDYRAELNDEQFAAVTSAPGPALVIAGAGSGKTRTLTYRVAYLLDQGVDPRHILLLTFTNKAAREMTERVRELVPHDLSPLWSGTFHSIGNRILRRHAEDMGLTKSFSILDRDDQKSLLSGVVAGMDIDTSARRFPKADVLATMFSLVENTGISLEDLIFERYPYFEDWQKEIAEVHQAYTARKLETNSVDFDDLLVLTLKLFKEQPDVLGLYRKRFRHILVDEYQDTNAVQCELIDLMAGDGAVMAVGDDAQSIYSWRGADMKNILNFPRRYGGCRTFKIETNYRSVPEILDLSNAAIRANSSRFEKDLRSARKTAGVKPALVPLEDPSTQARFVAQRLLELRDEGVPLEEMAVIYRAHFQSLEIQMELTSHGIPFAITSGLRFFEQAHIKDVAAFLRFVTNRRDETSFKRIAMLLPGIGAKGADKLWRAWLATGWAPREETPEWPEVMGGLKGVPKKAAQHWQQLGYILAEMTPGGEFATPTDMVYSVLEGMYDEHLRASYDNYENRRSDIEQLMSYGGNFEDVLEFLSQLSLLGSADGEPTGDRSEPDTEKVTLSSIHQAKGLEWRAVFVIWLAEGQFPNGRVIEAEDAEMMEEERRLFYVAVTRAKDELYLSYPMINPKSYSGDVIQRPSRFLDDFPRELVEEWKVGSSWEEPDWDAEVGEDFEVDEPF